MAGLVGIGVGAHDFTEFAISLGLASEALPNELMLRLRSKADVVVDRAVSEIDPYSTSIPPTIHARVEGERIEVTADGVLAGLFEFGNRGGSEGEFQHPVFGHKNVIVDQRMHPFLGPAFEDEHENIIEAASGALEMAIEMAAHFRG